MSASSIDGGRGLTLVRNVTQIAQHNWHGRQQLYRSQVVSRVRSCVVPNQRANELKAGGYGRSDVHTCWLVAVEVGVRT